MQKIDQKIIIWEINSILIDIIINKLINLINKKNSL